MAVDSRDKRSSAIAVSSPWRGMLPLPDGTVGTPDMQHIAWLYRGIAASQAVVTSLVGFTMKPNRPEFTMPANRPEYSMGDNRPEYTMRRTT